ncbi:hypothetical protein GC098_23575 [Paenibacillus sp. LMG 31458]|uniref:RNA polymerase sigma factor 54 core-binding domain-containing protein n=1 Tax=Paenibacillus phytorum TaxID=2654977 RepID=A0ABX1Y159_9BACL|nr:hypothetical protein [Paenibacillus phytorum]
MQECLAIQIARDPHAPVGALDVVMDHLQDLGKGKCEKVSKELDIEAGQVSKILEYMRQSIHSSNLVIQGSVKIGTFWRVNCCINCNMGNHYARNPSQRAVTKFRSPKTNAVSTVSKYREGERVVCSTLRRRSG